MCLLNIHFIKLQSSAELTPPSSQSPFSSNPMCYPMLHNSGSSIPPRRQLYLSILSKVRTLIDYPRFYNLRCNLCITFNYCRLFYYFKICPIGLNPRGYLEREMCLKRQRISDYRWRFLDPRICLQA